MARQPPQQFIVGGIVSECMLVFAMGEKRSHLCWCFIVYILLHSHCCRPCIMDLYDHFSAARFSLVYYWQLHQVRLDCEFRLIWRCQQVFVVCVVRVSYHV